MKITPQLVLSALAAMFIVSCETPPPYGFTPPGSPTPVQAVAYPYPNITGVWQGPYATMTIGSILGTSFAMSMKKKNGMMHASTGHWGQPYHRHFIFMRSDGGIARATVDSLNPATISVEDDDGQVRAWTRR